MHIKGLQNIDLDKMAVAIEADAGQALPGLREGLQDAKAGDRKSTRLNSSHH